MVNVVNVGRLLVTAAVAASLASGSPATATSVTNTALGSGAEDDVSAATNMVVLIGTAVVTVVDGVSATNTVCGAGVGAGGAASVVRYTVLGKDVVGFTLLARL